MTNTFTTGKQIFLAIAMISFASSTCANSTSRSLIPYSREELRLKSDVNFRTDIFRDWNLKGQTVNNSQLKDCGFEQVNLKGRIADCAEMNQKNSLVQSSYDVEVGNRRRYSGPHDWLLVTHRNGKSVWFEDYSGRLWSHSLGKISSKKYLEALGAPGLSYCSEDPNHPEETPTQFDAAKGGMRLKATSSSPSVVWTLPTMNTLLSSLKIGLSLVIADQVQVFSSNSNQNFLTSTFYGGSYPNINFGEVIKFVYLAYSQGQMSSGESYRSLFADGQASDAGEESSKKFHVFCTAYVYGQMR